MNKVMCILAFVFTAAPSLSFAITLVRDGNPSATIVIGEKPSQQARGAAGELQKYLRLTTGAKLPVVEAGASVTGPKVLVGQAAARDAAAQIGLTIPSGLTYQFDEEGYIVVADKDTLILAGNETAPYEGTFFAVYDFLHALGCRWFFPGELGEVLPRAETITMDPARRVMRPELRVRDTWYSGHLATTSTQQAEFRAWKRRNRMCRPDFWLNGTAPSARFLQNPADDSTWRLLPKAKYWSSHPEYYAMTPGGGRNDRFICMSNPDALQAAADTIVQHFQQTDRYAFAFSPPDAPVLCHCPDCTSAVHGGFGGEGHGDVSDAYFAFVFRLADKAAERCPNRWITTMAYYNRCRPPEGVERKRKNVLIQLASIQQCSLHSYTQKDCWLRQQFGAMLRRWADLTAGQVFYEYDPHDWTHLHQPVWRSQSIADDLRLLKQLGGWGFSNEGQMSWLSTGLNYYVRARLAWNLKEDPADIVADFCRQFFGPAQDPMLRYYTAAERALREAKTHFAGGGTADDILTVLKRPLLDQCASWLDDAQKLTQTEPFKSRVAAFKAQFDRVYALAKARSAMARGDYAQAADWGEAMVKTVARVNNSMLLQDAGPWGGSLSGKNIADSARRVIPWLDGTKGKLLGVLPVTASFRTDPDSEGVIYRWYLPNEGGEGWRDIRLTSSWYNQGVATAGGSRYKGVAWYRAKLTLPRTPNESVRMYVPELRGSAVWVWCSGRFAGYAAKSAGALTIDVSGLVQAGENLFVFRVNGDGGLTLPPFLFIPPEGTPDKRSEIATVFPSKWLFRLDPKSDGEREGWYRRDKDTRDWQPIPVPSWWEDTPIGAYDGDAWYRVRFTIPADVKGKRLVLGFGAVDEEAWVYLNGELIGEHTTASTGRTVHQIWDEPFNIPVRNARWGEDNVLVVRVRDSQLMGGIFKPVRLYARP